MPHKKLSFAVLRSPNFRLLLFTRIFALAALQAQSVIVGWQIYSITKNPLMLGFTGLAEAVPAIACALFAGHIVDISRPQRVYLNCLALLTVNTFILFLVGSGIVDPGHHFFLFFIYAGIFVSGFARSFIMPASFSLLAQIVPRRDIPAASAWLSAGFQAATIVSPAAAGLIYGGYGPMAAWVMPLLLMTTAFSLMYFLRPDDSHRPAGKREPAMKSIREGWQFIMQSPVLLAAMSLDMLAVLFGGAIALLPAFADQILHIGPEGLGILRTAPALGAILTALFFAVRPMTTIRATTLLLVVAGFGVSMIGFGLSTVFALSVFFLSLSGGFDSVSMVIRGTIMQLMTPDHMRGRVSSVNSMFIISSNELGAFESGALARLIGLVPAVAIGGAGTLLVTGMTALLSPSFRRTVIRLDDEPAAAPGQPLSAQPSSVQPGASDAGDGGKTA